MIIHPIVIIGAGPAGLSAAHEAVRYGASVIVIDERPEIGGHLRDYPYQVDNGVGGDVLSDLISDFPDGRATVLTLSIAWGLFQGLRVAVGTGGRSQIVDASAVILATGVIQQPTVFSGWTCPGVMTVFAARGLLRRHVLPGHRAVVLGKSAIGECIARELSAAGGEVAGIVDIQPPEAAQSSAESRSLVPRVHLVRVEGDPRVKRVVLRSSEGEEQTMDVDLVVVAAGIQPLVELALQIRCQVKFDVRLGGYVPCFAPDLASSQRGIFVTGGCIGARYPDEALLLGRLAGTAAAAMAGWANKETVGAVQAGVWGCLETRMGCRPDGERFHAWEEIAQGGFHSE